MAPDELTAQTLGIFVREPVEELALVEGWCNFDLIEDE